jgi:CubicO group peptidase (beta-lactamase class C family)
MQKGFDLEKLEQQGRQPMKTLPNVLVLLLSILLGACSDSNNNNYVKPIPVMPDFTAADSWLEDFVAAQELFPGGSMVIVDRNQGEIHRSAFGNQTEDAVVLLASLSKVPTVSLLMALHEDDANVDFDIQAPIANYLPWLGVWDPAITTEHLVSNRSGIPGLLYQLTSPAAYAPHFCQFLTTGTLQACAETLFTTPLPTLPAPPANSAFDYGGSQWQLSGAVAELVGGGIWSQLWDKYVAQPCGIELARYGNMLSVPTTWDGNPDSLLGLDNPNMEAGMISNLDDYARIISMHLNDGVCGDNQVLSPQAVTFMREQRTAEQDTGSLGAGLGYAMGWWVVPPKEGGSVYLYVDPGYFGSVSWVDVERGYGGVVFFEDYTGAEGSVANAGVIRELIPIIEEALDAAR